MNTLLLDNYSVSLGDKEIVKGINLLVKQGEVHAVMGPNGSGKSTLAQSIMAKEDYTLGAKSGIFLNGKSIKKLPTDKRARMGLFLGFQTPVPVSGVKLAQVLRASYAQVNRKAGGRQGKKFPHNSAFSLWDLNSKLVRLAEFLDIPESFLGRFVNEDFSGGEKKKTELLQALVLKPKFAVFDEIDTGLDVDALKTVAKGIGKLRSEKTGIIIITHYKRILNHIRPDRVHILIEGRIVLSGDYKLADRIEKKGYASFKKA